MMDNRKQFVPSRALTTLALEQKCTNFQQKVFFLSFNKTFLFTLFAACVRNVRYADIGRRAPAIQTEMWDSMTILTFENAFV